MSDAELSEKIAEAGGKVAIGFKDSVAAAGVDDAGRVLASAAAVAAGKTLVRTAGIEITYEFVDIPAVLARMPASLLPAIRRNSLIEFVEPDLPGEFLDQTTTWNIQRVDAPTAWASSTGAGAKLLIIDSGIDDSHPDLAPAVIQACDGSDGVDEFGHGTAVAGIAAATNNSIQVVGAAHGVALWSSRVGATAPTSGATACAVEFGRINNVHAMNMSLNLSPLTALTDQINAAYSSGIVLVAAAGNGSGGAVVYPASLSAVIAVSATDTNNAFASFSSAGSKVEIAAPGTTVTNTRGLTTTCLGGSSSSTCGFLVQGTSFAAPHVAAAGAILKMYNPSWSNVEIRYRLGAGASDLGASGRDSQFGYGLLNIPAAIAASPPPPPPPPALTVTIGGPWEIQGLTGCNWPASASGGTPPYSYSWFANGLSVGTDSPDLWYVNEGSAFMLSVSVIDAAGKLATDDQAVSISPGAPCPAR